jgi:hypothetical protein
MPRRSYLTLRWFSVAGLFGMALAVGLLLARPLKAASIGFDSQVAVLDFARLLAGRHVELFLATTPKPLLTLIFGPLELLTHDWRTLTWATLIAFGLAVVLSAELARRFGGIAAWAFVGVGLAGSGALLFDVGYALAIPWALLGWSIAGLAISQPQPRYGLAGIALLLATLARIETLLIVGLVAVVLVGLNVPPLARAAEARGIGRPPRRAGLVLVAFAALPIMCLHDLLIYGDPLFWSTVSARYSATTPLTILRLPAVFMVIVRHYVHLWLLTLLGLAGVARLLRERAWGVLVGLIALGPGMAMLLLFLAFRHIYVPNRYLAPIDIVLIFAAGIGTAWILREGVAWLGRRPGSRQLGAAAWTAGLVSAAAISLAVVAAWPSGILDSTLRQSVATSLALAADIDRMVPILRQIVDQSPGARVGPSGRSGTAGKSNPALLLVPLPYRPGISIDLDIPLTNIGGIQPSRVGPPGGYPAIGQFVAHDRHADGELPAFRPYETTVVRTINGVSIVPIASDPNRGWWITEIQAPK